MNFKPGNRIKYYFPNPGNSGKEFVSGEIIFAGETKIEILCDDNTKLTISQKNFYRIILCAIRPVLV